MNNSIYVAKIVAVHGLRGAIKVQVEDENPKRFIKGRKLYLGKYDFPVHVESYSSKGLYGILKLEEINSIEEAEKYISSELKTTEEELPKPEEGKYYIKDLIDCRCIDLEENELGILKDVLSYPANDVYVVETPDNKTVYVPAVPAVIKKVDISARKITIDPMKGLFDEN